MILERLDAIYIYKHLLEASCFYLQPGHLLRLIYLLYKSYR